MQWESAELDWKVVHRNRKPPFVDENSSANGVVVQSFNCGGNLIDADGNLYGTWENAGSHGFGSVFKLTPTNGGWTYTSLHDFTGGVDGSYPISGVVMDANGNLYGGTLEGETYGAGVLFEIAP